MNDAKPTAAPAAASTPTPPSAPSAASAAAPPVSAPPSETGGASDPAPAAAPEKPAPKADAWAKLSAEEKRVRKERAALEAERKAHADAVKARTAREELEAKAKAGDWEAREKLLAETGITYDELTRRALNKGKSDKGETALRELEQLKADLAKREADAKQAAEESAKQAAEAELASRIDGFCTYVSTEAASTYPLLSGEIEANRAYVDATIRNMVALHNKAIEAGEIPAGTLLVAEEAAKKFEEYLVAETNRRMARLRPAPPPEADPKNSTTTSPREETGRAAGADGPRRLTNGLSAERTTPAGSRPTPKTAFERDAEERERIKRAANAYSPRR
jgi:hypothetical protein